jgi:predicted DNA-binding transcriptional regulator YafY
MRSWGRDGEGTRIRLSEAAASRLRRDWFYRHAAFESDGASGVVMSLPDSDPRTILPLVRWLGAEAEILAPAELRERCAADLEAIRRRYEKRGERG